MPKMSFLQLLAAGIARAFRGERGSVTVETMIALPVLIGGLILTAVAFDGFRTRSQSQTAAFTVADLISRETRALTGAYLEGMNNVYDFLANARMPTRMRISAVAHSAANNRVEVVWSYGTRGLRPLTTADLHGPPPSGGTGGDAFNFTSAAMQNPVPDLRGRIPPVSTGETLIVVESFALWSPVAPGGIAPMRLSPVVVIRPRYTPWLNLEDAITPTTTNWDNDEEWQVITAGTALDGTVTLNGKPVTREDMNFTSAPFAGWSATAHGTASGGNRFQGPFGAATNTTPLTYAVNLPSGHIRAVIAFDLLILDAWAGYSGTGAVGAAGDTLTITVNGQPISIDAFRPGHATFYPNARQHRVVIGNTLYRVAMTRTQQGTNIAGASGNDEIWRVTITIDRPPTTFTLGFRANLGGTAGSRSFGIDNFLLTSQPGSGTNPAFVPNAATIIGNHPQTNFPVFSGCPDRRITGAALTVRNSDLASPIRLFRQAAGTQDVDRPCPDVDGKKFFHAAPTYLMHYDNEGQTAKGRHLRIRFDKGASQSGCEPALLVQTPQDQWFFSDKADAKFDMGAASSGTYAIFLGRRDKAACNVMLEIARY